MERSSYTAMTPSLEAPNPLRPYYRPPSIGVLADLPPNATSHGTGSVKASSPSFGSSARDILSDLNYREILGQAGPSTGASIKRLLDQALWKYSSVFMAQPFEVAKMVLQCQLATGNLRIPKGDFPRRQQHRKRPMKSQEVYPSDDEEEDDDDEPSYFTSTAPHNSSESYPASNRRRSSVSRSPSSTSTRPPLPHFKLDLRKQDSLLEVLSELWQREGTWGVWKGTNTTFLYSILLKSFETWTRSCLSALLSIPDPGLLASSGGVGGLDIIDSPFPLASLSVAVAAAGIAGLFLAPLDIVRTRLILTSTTDSPRSILPSLISLATWTCPISLLAPTLLHSTIPTLVSTSTPLLLRSNFRIDPILTPAYYSVCTFLASIAELFLKLPVETVLRRGQIGIVSQTPRTTQRRSSSKTRSHQPAPEQESSIHTVVEVGPYTGVVSTIWHIVREEGETVETTAATTRGTIASHAHRPVYTTRRGQGVQGLWKGWRVGWWGLVGIWSAAAVGSASGKGGEF